MWVSEESFEDANNFSSILLDLCFLSQEQYSKVNNRYRELNSGVIERQRRLTRVTEELESVKQEMEERGTIMSDGSEYYAE